MRFDWAGIIDYTKRHPVQPPETQYELPRVTQKTGFAKLLVTTHRQNLLLPPRAHGSFSLAELI